jgi:hypothetical protein
VGEGSALPPGPESATAGSPGKPDPVVVAGLEDLARAVFRDRGELEDYPGKVAGWLHCYPADWVRDAIVCTGAKDGIRSGGLAQYTAGCLRRWCPDGPTRGEVRKAEATVGASARPAPPTEYHTAPANSRHRIKRQGD